MIRIHRCQGFTMGKNYNSKKQRYKITAALRSFGGTKLTTAESETIIKGNLNFSARLELEDFCSFKEIGNRDLVQSRLVVKNTKSHISLEDPPGKTGKCNTLSRWATTSRKYTFQIRPARVGLLDVMQLAGPR